jgi:hypothetical protein
VTEPTLCMLRIHALLRFSQIRHACELGPTVFSAIVEALAKLRCTADPAFLANMFCTEREPVIFDPAPVVVRHCLPCLYFMQGRYNIIRRKRKSYVPMQECVNSCVDIKGWFSWSRRYIVTRFNTSFVIDCSVLMHL